MRDKDFIKSNKGFSLVELIVVIAIMGILVGGMSLGLSLAFSKDAHKCATAINDAIYEARMVSMTKAGDYTLELSKNATGEYIAQIIETGTGTVEKEIALSNAGRIDTIEVKLDSDSTADVTVGTTTKSQLTFDKSKGNVSSLNGHKVKTPAETDQYTDGVITYDITSTRGSNASKESKVSLVTATGKHTIGDF